ncbi:sulfatase-like hydrolase/transferase [Reichenbachiella sp. MALMAid0571]|uniref:sulfatase-like hydrolase/transferase n=1 Tax=Reichenbachiella sp. MALMAid0571 TaxID=3143939 RepID=UPI0032DEE90F
MCTNFRINFLLALSILIFTANCTTKESGSSKEISNEKPNIIIIMADDLGYGDLSGFGNATINTPNLDRMAEEGIRFTDFHSNGAVCSPTRAALVTGKYQQRVGVEGVVTAKSHREVGLALEEITFADAMKAEGYVTGMVGKWHLGYPERYNPVHQGFDEFVGYVSGNVDYHSHIDQEAHEDWWWQNKLQKEEGYSTDLITKHSLAFINKHKDDNFFLYIPHEAPHGPIQGRKSKPFRVIGDNQASNPEENLKVTYKEMIEVMDEGIGEVIKTLKSLNLEKNTLVFFCSDNGPANLGSSGGLHGSKGSVWEGGHRVPAIAWWPGKIKPNQESNQTTMTMDLLPTMMSLVGGKTNTDWDGIDISGVLLENATLPERDLFWRHYSNDGSKQSVAIRSGDWKLLQLNQENEPQLYNLKEDLSETKDLSGVKPQLKQELWAKLNNWQKEVTKGVKKVSP